MVLGDFTDLLFILADREKEEPIPRKFFLDYNIVKNRNNTFSITKDDNSIFYSIPCWLNDIFHELQEQGRNEIREEIKDILKINKKDNY